MATVCCPSCGTINPDGQRKLARCFNCHEWLTACRYCTYYDARMMDCTHPSRPDWLRIVDATESLNCPDFTSLLSGPPARARGWRILRTALLATVLAALGLFGVVRAYEAATRPAPPVLLRASVSTSSDATRNTGLDVKVLVRNEADYPAENVQVFIGGPGMRRIVCEWTEPPDALVEASRTSTCGWVGYLEPGEIGSVQFHFTATEPCQVKLVAHIAAANLEGPERITIEGEILP
ncbi:MAG TPA: hypothetical protein VMY87_04750 [Armatimonadota bacterium]|nr:hypothetical protein [Armatimonadota bacterium]